MTMITKEELFAIVNDHKVFDDSTNKFLLVDENLQILYVNFSPADGEKKRNPGDFLKCQNAVKATHGCGSHENCKNCRLRNMVTTSIKTQKKMEADVDFLIYGNKDCNAHAVCTPFIHDGKPYAIVLLLDKTDQHHELMLERIFLHDILNLTGALNGTLQFMEDEDPKALIPVVKALASQLQNEIMAQRNFLYAQKGLLKLNNADFKASEVTEFAKQSIVTSAFELYGVKLEINSTLADEVIYSDKTLVNRVVYNMLKNACEANPNSTIVMQARSTADKVIYSVHNEMVMPDDMKSKIFIYGNTTKGNGRGLGTYSMKLIGENYLKGRVWFRSEEGFGTEFYFELDKKV